REQDKDHPARSLLTPAGGERGLRILHVRLAVEVRKQQQVGPRDKKEGGNESNLGSSYGPLAHENVCRKKDTSRVQDRAKQFLDGHKETLGSEVDGDGCCENQTRLKNSGPDPHRQEDVGYGCQSGYGHKNSEMTLIKIMTVRCGFRLDAADVQQMVSAVYDPYGEAQHDQCGRSWLGAENFGKKNRAHYCSGGNVDTEAVKEAVCLQCIGHKLSTRTEERRSRVYDDLRASAPPTISRISFVIAACRVRLYMRRSSLSSSPAFSVALSMAVMRAPFSAALESRSALNN